MSEPTSTDPFDKWFARLIRIVMLLLGAGGFGFEVLSPHRTLWVGLLSVGLLAGQAAALVDALSEGVTINFKSRKRDEKP